MAKTKTPFFSMGAQGSVGESITAQRHNSSTLFRSKPLPTDPYSLPQAYRRWLYVDYAHLWTQQSLATRQSYQSLGSRYHLTGFQYWMRAMLTTLPDILVWSKLDEKSGTWARDSGKLGNDALIIGASPSTMGINGGYHFDGINDRITYPINNYLNSLDSFSIEFLFRTSYKTLVRTITGNRDTTGPAYGWTVSIAAATGILTVLFDNALGVTAGSSTFDIADGEIHHFCLTRQNPDYILYIDGQPVDTFSKGGLITSIDPTYHGFDLRANTYWPGDLDNFFIFNRALDAITVLRHSERRYLPISAAPAPPPLPIDVGPDAINRPASGTPEYTRIYLVNASNLSGIIDEVDVFAKNNISTTKCGLFYLVSGTTYKCRSIAVLGPCVGGVKSTFSGLSMAVEAGDFIGLYFTGGTIARTLGAPGNMGWIYGDHCIVDDQASYSLYAAVDSIFGSGHT